MRISDWSSVVCSSDLRGDSLRRTRPAACDHAGRLPAARVDRGARNQDRAYVHAGRAYRSEEHTSELQSLMRISYAVFCLKKKNTYNKQQHITAHITHPQHNNENTTTKSKAQTQNTDKDRKT